MKKHVSNFSKELFNQLDEDIVALDVMASEAVSTNKFYIGIDNGVSGSIAIISPDNTITFAKIPVKTEQSYTQSKQNISRIKTVDLIKLIEVSIGQCDTSLVHVVIERPMVNPTRFKASASGLRALEAVLIVVDDLMHLPFTYIDSKRWQKELLPKGIGGDELKTASLQIGNRLFPQFREHRHPDRDSLLIAEYARRKRL
jgi:hypothetical protein